MVHRSIHGGRGEEGKPQAQRVPRVLEGEETVQATFLERPRGGGTLEVVYSGPLMKHRPLYVRFGERRGGQTWANAHDVPMAFEDGKAVASIPMGPEPELEGACMAFFTHKDGAEDGEALWDNAGHALGYYEVDLASGRVLRR
ncbi:MAG: hypothetical protein QM765_18780 [Myxococcales bacterium]